MSGLDFDLKDYTTLGEGQAAAGATTDSEERNPHQIWLAAQQLLAQSVPETAFQAWIAPLRLLGNQTIHSPDIVSAQAPSLQFQFAVANRFKLEWLRAQYGAKIHQALVKVSGKDVGVNFVLQQKTSVSHAAGLTEASPSFSDQPRPTRFNNHPKQPRFFVAEPAPPAYGLGTNNHKPYSPASNSLDQQGTVLDDTAWGTLGAPGALELDAQNAWGAQEHKPARGKSSVGRSFLNPHYTFATLVEGNTNRMARAAGLQISQSFLGGNQRYNPFYIYGGVGLGKTHLMHAIGNALLQSKPQAKIHYVHAEQFVTDVVRATQRKSFDDFKAVYHDLDLLLIDDVQFFGGKERTQEEFFNAFEALLAKQSQIVLSSDTYPKALSDISSRLVSRFDQGLTTAIEPPELELRVAILLNKAEQERVALPDDVAFFIAKHIRSNVRELEGALRKVMAWSRFNQEEINISLCKKALRDLLSIQNQQVSVENIQKTVADYYKIKVADMFSKRRPAEIAFPRQVAMYLAKEMTQKSLPEIGNLFGGKDHTTVLHAVRKISGLRAKDLEFSQVLHVIEQTLKH